MAEDRGPELASVLGLFLGLTWLFVLLRVYVKLFLSKAWARDDTLLVIALVSYSTYVSCSLAGIKYGTGRHVGDISPQDVSRALYFWFLCELFYTITTALLRLSIAVFLLRLCIKPLHKYIIFGTMGVVIAFSTFYLCLVLFQCNPVRFFWDQYKGIQGQCMNPAAVPDASIAHSAVSASADWVLGLLPILLIWHLQINMRTKASIAGILALGVLAGVATLIRVPYIKVLALTDDFLYATTDVAIWSTIEPGLGIVAFAAAPLRLLFRRFYSISKPNQENHADTITMPSNAKPFSKQQRSNVSSATADSIQLRTDVEPAEVTIISMTNALAASQEYVKQDVNDIELGGIQVTRTVDVRRSLDNDGSPVQSGPDTTRIERSRSFDMV